jgi:hypothetical protein
MDIRWPMDIAEISAKDAGRAFIDASFRGVVL